MVERCLRDGVGCPNEFPDSTAGGTQSGMRCLPPIGRHHKMLQVALQQSVPSTVRHQGGVRILQEQIGALQCTRIEQFRWCNRERAQLVHRPSSGVCRSR